MKLTISIGQMNVLKGQPERNFACVREWTEEAARRGSDLVVFPELWDTGYDLERALELGSPVDRGRFAGVAALARQHRIHIVGSMLEIVPGQSSESPAAYNSAAWFTPDGERAGLYRKLHLFRLMKEDWHLAPGSKPVMLDLPWGRTGLAICYDLRFPELFRGYALGGAVLTVIPAQWPHPRMAHWRTLLRARAIENQMVVVGCNQVGRAEETRFGGRSAIVDAWGEALVEGGECPVLLTHEVDVDQVADVRQRIPVFEDRRPDIYP